MNGPDQDDQDGAGEVATQRVVNASDCSPLHTTAASSVFATALQGWRRPAIDDATAQPQDTAPAPAPTPAPTTAPSPQTEEEKLTMATTKRAGRARKFTNGSPQMQICSALKQHGDLAREALAEACEGLTAQQFASALNNAKTQGRIKWIEKDGVLRLTKAGMEWIAAGEEATSEAPEAEPTVAKTPRKTAHRRGRAKRKEVDTHPPEEEAADATFRCAVMSDGCFFISKGDVTLELDADEHRQMLHYLDRMAEPEAA